GSILEDAIIQFDSLDKIGQLEKPSQYGNTIEDRTEANELINSVKICALAVGSGHFLFYALNEISAVKKRPQTPSGQIRKVAEGISC
ncbi:MAG TPA: hypothetical protein VK957_09340, partial [Lunatimonas sp.]|nr:hypothetical protein [Lunatimonas sp.]